MRLLHLSEDSSYLVMMEASAAKAVLISDEDEAAIAGRPWPGAHRAYRSCELV